MTGFSSKATSVGGLTLYGGAGVVTAWISGEIALCLVVWLLVLPASAALVFWRRRQSTRAAPTEILPRVDDPDTSQVQPVSVERRARGVAHDLNNLLGVMRSSLEVLDEGLPPNDPLRTETQALAGTIERASDLARKLVDSRISEPRSAKAFDLLQATLALEPLLARMLPPGVRLHFEGDAKSWVLAEQTQVEQLIVNLVANARDAVNGSGEIWIELASKWLDKSELPTEGRLQPGCYAVLRVRDTGAGIPAEVLPRIFDPFFTTKPIGWGTGLGLAASRDLICAAGGDVMVASRPGHGTCFKVLLPEHAAPLHHQSLSSTSGTLGHTRSPGTPAGAMRAWAGEPSSGTFDQQRSILVVDDQPELLRSTVRLLKRAGHDVLSATDAESALEIVRESPNRIGTLVTDLHLPGKSGQELVQLLRELCGELAVVYVTGTQTTDQLGVDDRAAVVKKPFRSEQLLSALQTARTLMDSRVA